MHFGGAGVVSSGKYAYLYRVLKRYVMKILLDVHTHTIASGHAFSTLQEMVQAAANRGLRILGITEHTGGIPGTCSDIYFRNLPMVPRNMYGVELLMGAEINIVDYTGRLDLEEKYFRFLDLRIAGLHSLCYRSGTVEENTAAVLGAIYNPHIDIISHPGDGTAELDFERLVLAAKENNVLLEINNSSLNPLRHKEKAKGNNLEILRLCKHYEQPVILGSDAHISFSIADYRWLYPLLAETDFPEALILNDKPEAFKARLKRNREETVI